jgi:hypothetical protein
VARRLGRPRAAGGCGSGGAGAQAAQEQARRRRVGARRGVGVREPARERAALDQAWEWSPGPGGAGVRGAGGVRVPSLLQRRHAASASGCVRVELRLRHTGGAGKTWRGPRTHVALACAGAAQQGRGERGSGNRRRRSSCAGRRCVGRRRAACVCGCRTGGAGAELRTAACSAWRCSRWARSGRDWVGVQGSRTRCGRSYSAAAAGGSEREQQGRAWRTSEAIEKKATDEVRRHCELLVENGGGLAQTAVVGRP